MEITKSIAADYQSRIKENKERLLKVDFQYHDTKLKEMAQNVRDDFLKNVLNFLPKNILKEIAVDKNSPKSLLKLSNRKLSNDQLFDKVFEDIKNQTFPIFHQTNNAFERDFLNYLSQINKVKQNLTDLQEEYLDLLNLLEESTQTIIKFERNKFFSFFQRPSTKEKINHAKKRLNQEYSKLNSLETSLTTLMTERLESVQDIHELERSTDDYVHKMIEVLEVNTEKPDPLFSKIVDINEDILYQIDQFNIQKIDEQIIELWQQFVEDQIQNELDTIPLDVLQASFPNDFSWHEYYLAGYKTIGDIKNVDNHFLRLRTDISQQESERLQHHIEAFIQNRIKRYKPKFNVDKFGTYEFVILNKIHQRQQIPSRTKQLIQKIQPDLDELSELLLYLKAEYYNNIQIAELSEKKRRKIIKILKDWVLQLSAIQDLIKDVDLTTPKALSKKQLKHDFLKNSATYYAVLDQLIGVSSDYKPNDIPDYIVDEVNAFDINLVDLEVALRSYQLFGAKYGLHFKRTLLGDEMGLGKTIQAIAMINHLYQSNQRHSIVICPLSVLPNWQREIDKWSYIPNYVYRGKDRKPILNKWLSQGGILLLNYEQAKHLLENDKINRFACLIVDEAHLIKNPTAKRTQAVKELGKKAEYALFLTGTPIENRVKEMQHLISMLNESLSNRITRQMAERNPEEFKQLTALVYLRRKRIDVLEELPNKEEIELWSNFSDVEQAYYNEALEMGISGLMKMRQAGFMGQNPKHSAKLSQVMSICNEANDNDHKVLIFSFFLDVLNIIEQELGNSVIGRIQGSVSVKERQNMIDDFTNASAGSVLLCQIDSAGVGLNIQAANVIILCEPQWKPSTENQAISRAYRMGQTRDVIVYRLLTQDSIDESITEVLYHKTKIFNQYANDSIVSEAYDRREIEEQSAKNIKKYIFKIEQERLLELKNKEKSLTK
ncbi:DEAD/DEAH box helicase family protein [Aerococcaceae bacterium DSM 111020]|nr:DEAD/DEAH box helicase family protein [Aerococcaceae bacterium DSM 111020]